MTRDQAKRLIGQPVTAWTAANGEYTGILREVLTNGKWRGVVEITGVLKVATHLERGRCVRKGFRIGEEIEVGGANIRRLDPENQAIGRTYKEALELELMQLNHWLKRHHDTPNEFRSKRNGWLQPNIEIIKVFLASEDINGKPL